MARLVAALIVAVTGLAFTSGRSTAAPAPGLRLASQTPWVAPGQEFDIGLDISGAAPGATLVVTVYDQVHSRSEFARTLTGKISEGTFRTVVAKPVASFVPDATGAIEVPIPVQDPQRPRDPARLPFRNTGVYPVRVELRPGDNSPPVDLVTHLLYFDGTISGNRLDVSWIVPVHAVPHPGPDGVETISSSDSQSLNLLARSLAAYPTLPVVLQPTPDTVAALASSARPLDRQTLKLLAQPLAARQLLAGTYVPVSLPALLATGLTNQATTALGEGGDAISTALASRPDGRTWVEDGPVNNDSATFLRDAQVDHLVVPEPALSPISNPTTLTQPFELDFGQGTTMKAAVADAGLTTHFDDRSDPVLAAHQLLADLAILYGDAPGTKTDHRGVVVSTPQDWQPDAAFLQSFLEGLAKSPLLNATTLDGFFATVPEATVSHGRAPLVRKLTPDPRIFADAAGLSPDAVRSTSARLAAFSSVLDKDNPILERDKRMLLVALSDDLDPQSRRAQLGRVDANVRAGLHLIKLPSPRRITLTARTGSLPVTVLSEAGYPMQVSVRLQSDKLSFPGAGSTGDASQLKEVRPGNNQESFTVRARTAGSFPLHISVYSPNGQLLLASTTFTVQSTALSGVGLVLTAASLLFLAVWWGRHALRGRRARRLVPSPVAGAAPSPSHDLDDLADAGPTPSANGTAAGRQAVRDGSGLPG
jgi:hypothetical protein